MGHQFIELKIRIPNQTKSLGLIGKISEELAAQIEQYSGNLETLAYQVNVVLTEALANAIIHANANDPEQEVIVRITVDDNLLLLQVFDHGKGFNLDLIPKYRPEEPSDELQDHGRGLFIMRSLMDSVEYRRTEQGNVLEMKKQFR